MDWLVTFAKAIWSIPEAGIIVTLLAVIQVALIIWGIKYYRKYMR